MIVKLTKHAPKHLTEKDFNLRIKLTRYYRDSQDCITRCCKVALIVLGLNKLNMRTAWVQQSLKHCLLI